MAGGMIKILLFPPNNIKEASHTKKLKINWVI